MEMIEKFISIPVGQIAKVCLLLPKDLVLMNVIVRSKKIKCVLLMEKPIKIVVLQDAKVKR